MKKVYRWYHAVMHMFASVLVTCLLLASSWCLISLATSSEQQAARAYERADEWLVTATSPTEAYPSSEVSLEPERQVSYQYTYGFSTSKAKSEAIKELKLINYKNPNNIFHYELNGWYFKSVI